MKVNALITNYIKAKANSVTSNIGSILFFTPKMINESGFTTYEFTIAHDNSSILFRIEMNAEPKFVKIRINEGIHSLEVNAESNSSYEQSLINSLVSCFEAMKTRAGY